jgi:hypothetical protein
VTIRVPASDNKRVAAYARFARSGEHGAGAPRRQRLNVFRHRREQKWFGAPEKREEGSGSERNGGDLPSGASHLRGGNRPPPHPGGIRRRRTSSMGSPQGSEGNGAGLNEVTCVGGGLG